MSDQLEYEDLIEDEKEELEQAIVNGFLSKACGHLLPDGYGIVVIIEEFHVVIFAQYDDGFRTLGMRMAMDDELEMDDGTVFRLSIIEERIQFNNEAKH
jgi:hypothetical protein